MWKKGEQEGGEEPHNKISLGALIWSGAALIMSIHFHDFIRLNQHIINTTMNTYFHDLIKKMNKKSAEFLPILFHSIVYMESFVAKEPVTFLLSSSEVGSHIHLLESAV